MHSTAQRLPGEYFFPDEWWQWLQVRTRVRLLGRYVSMAWLVAAALAAAWTLSPVLVRWRAVLRPLQPLLLLWAGASVLLAFQYLFRGRGASPYVPQLPPSELDWKCTVAEWHPARQRVQDGLSLALWWMAQALTSAPLWLLCAACALEWRPLLHAASAVQPLPLGALALPAVVLGAAAAICALLIALFTHSSARYGASAGVVARAAFGHRGGRYLYGITRIAVAVLMFCMATALGAVCTGKATALLLQPALQWLGRRGWWPGGMVPAEAWLRRAGEVAFCVLQAVWIGVSGVLERAAVHTAVTPYAEERPHQGWYLLRRLFGYVPPRGTPLPPYARAAAVALVASRVVAPAAVLSGVLLTARHALQQSAVAGGGSGLWALSLRQLWESVVSAGALDPSRLLPVTSWLSGALALMLLVYGDLARAAKHQSHQLTGVLLGLVPTVMLMALMAACASLGAADGLLTFWLAPATTAAAASSSFSSSSMPGSVWSAVAAIGAPSLIATGILLSNANMNLMPARLSLEKLAGRGLVTRAVMAGLAVTASLLALSPLAHTLFFHRSWLTEFTLSLVGAAVGPLVGIMLSDYFWWRRTSLRYADLYRERRSVYWYGEPRRGVHPKATLAYRLGLWAGACGLVQSLVARACTAVVQSAAALPQALGRYLSPALAASMASWLVSGASYLLSLQVSALRALWSCAFLVGMLLPGAVYYLNGVWERRWHVPFAMLLRAVFMSSAEPSPQHRRPDVPARDARRRPIGRPATDTDGMRM